MELGTDIDEVQVSLEDYILTLRMHRPEKKNALFGSMYTRMARLLEQANADTSVRVILIAGNDACFTSGNDVATFTASEPDDSGELPSVRFLHAIARCEVPIVAAVNGPAIGVGTTMLLHCDFVVAGEDAYFQTPFVNLGVCPEAGSSYVMPLRMGTRAAAQMLMLGDKYGAQQAQSQGLVSSVHPVASFEHEALQVARQLAGKPPASLRATKRLLRAPLMPALEAAMVTEMEEFGACLQTPEFGEAISAFMERREPDFSNC